MWNAAALSHMQQKGVVDPADIGTQRVLVDGKEIERVNKFKYFGSLVTVDSNSTHSLTHCCA